MRLWAISDLHLGYRRNRERLPELRDYGEDWLIVAGDVAEKLDQLEDALRVLCERFAQVLWVPGNHELWRGREPDALVGVAKYRKIVQICRSLGVLTPEDPYVVWPGPPGPHKLVPLFLLYDYTFGPDELSPAQAIEWAAQSGVVCADESYLLPSPHPSREAWCAHRCELSERRLEQEREGLPTVLINHWPLREDLAVLPLIPRFSLWCGTARTEDWHLRFEASVVVYGHLHIRRTQYRHGVRFEEVSFGYPRQHDVEQPIDHYLREIFPGPDDAQQLIRRYP